MECHYLKLNSSISSSVEQYWYMLILASHLLDLKEGKTILKVMTRKGRT